MTVHAMLPATVVALGRTYLGAVSPATYRVVGEALRIRAFARQLLDLDPGSASPLEARFEAARRCSALSWQTFLYRERCALPIHGALRALDLFDRLGPDVRETLEDFRTEELRRVLAVRAQATELARIAAELGVAPIVLKGGVAATRGTPLLDVTDLDVLLPPHEAERLAEELDRRGYSAKAGGSSQHLPGRGVTGSLPIEPHHRLHHFPPALMEIAVNRSLELGGLPPLRSLAPEDAVWNMLVHTSVQHPDRRGAIRDHLLIRDALSECSPAEIDAIRRRAGEHGQADVLLDLLSACTPGTDRNEDAFEPLAAGIYGVVVLVAQRSGIPPWLYQPLRKLVADLSDRRIDYRAQFGWFLLAHPKIRLPRAITALLRALRVLALLPPAVLLARWPTRAWCART